MRHLLGNALIIARRDFMAVVATPTFLLFLLAPFLMLGVSIASGIGGAYLAKGQHDSRQMIVIAAPADTKRLTMEDDVLRSRLYGREGGPPAVHFVPPLADPDVQQTRLLADKTVDATAVMRGPLERPVIAYVAGEADEGRYLALLAEEALRNAELGRPAGAQFSAPQMKAVQKTVPTRSRQQSTGSGTVVIMFMLTIMLASQAVGTLAEEKSNKVIEILAASVPLEAVFFGKLMGLFGIALVFVAFWGGLAALGIGILPASAGLGSFAPVIGTPIFIALAGCYFAMAFMLLGAIFLGVGAQASTMREIQMLSLPITLFQLIMFGVSMAAAGNPGSSVARFAEVFPFSSPFAMAARGATDATLWPHLLALGWQVLWVGITIALGAHFFRYGVLKSGVGPFKALGLMLTRR